MKDQPPVPGVQVAERNIQRDSRVTGQRLEHRTRSRLIQRRPEPHRPLGQRALGVSSKAAGLGTPLDAQSFARGTPT